MLSSHWKTTLAMILCAAVLSQRGLAQQPGPAQTPTATILLVDTANVVQYFGDTADPSKFATDPNVTTPVVPRNLNGVTAIGDIVAINAQPARGTMTRDGRTVFLNTAPTSGQALADTVRNAVTALTFEILKSDLTPIGTILAYGYSGGSAPIGAPLSVTGTNLVIVGGTGPFLGARGQMGKSSTVAVRQASITEDPGNRRRYGGGTERWVLQVIPMFRPEILMTAGVPVIAHASSNQVVTASNPAAPGEILTLFATGLGPTVPRVDPGQPFPASPPAVTNSPVQVTVNGQTTDAIRAVGVPGLMDTYAVTFLAPASAGQATVYLTAAWIAGPTATFIVQ